MTLLILHGALLSVALVATVTDVRTGTIPNWLTLPVMVASLALHLVLGGVQAGLSSSLGLLVCGLGPLLFFRLGAMGGGDVKLFAALGALAGAQLGLEIELVSLCLAFAYGLLRMARQRELLSMLRRSLQVASNFVLPERRRFVVAASELTAVRIGGAIFASACVCVLNDLLQRGQP